jgi:uncharacterized repeat protein (TIGR02543 family)
MAYELGSVSHADFSVHHSVLITDLQPGTIYNYQIISQDLSNNASFSENFEVTTDPSGSSPDPVVDIWYDSHQVFGHIGNPQQWANILGNVSDPEGIASLIYSLNRGPESPLSIGPDTRRLAADGDFNVDIAYTDLFSGSNQVVITATDHLDNTTVETVTVEYASGNVWPETYSIDWSSAITIPSVVQIVDGLWTLEADSIRTAALGYDRLVAIGDVSWDDYEVTVPITIHGIDPSGYQPPSNGPVVGILVRWTGHTDSPISGWQPKSGYLPLGAIGMYRWQDDALGDRLQIMGNGGIIVADDTSARKLEYDVPYIFKMRVETIPDQGGLYSLKVWEDGQSEPSEWDLFAQEGLSDPQNGSFLLLAHHVDASFGDVMVTPGPFFDDTVPPVISNTQVTPGETSAVVTWATNEPATSSVAYGQTTAYENGSVDDSALVTEHTIILTGLISDTLYHYQITSEDGIGNSASSTDLTFTTSLSDTTPPVISNIQVASGGTSATVTWTTDEPATSSVAYGQSTAYEIGSVDDSALVLEHTITLTDLVSETLYHYQVTSVDGSSNSASSTDLTFVLSSILSDDFNTCNLDTGLWEFIDPLGDATLAMTGTHTQDAWVSISAPEGDSHELWTGGALAPRIMQPANDTDFEIEVKFESEVTELYQEQGVMVEEDNQNFLRFEFYSDGTNTKIFAASLASGSATIHTDTPISGGAPLYMRVRRGGDQWTQSYSSDGVYWTTPVPFTHALTVTAVGAYAGNAGGASSPAHTAYIDYFFNAASPIIPEDGDRNTLTVGVNPVGSGTIYVDPVKSTYSCGEVVTLTVTADAGWTFDSWSGDLPGTTNPVAVTMNGSKVITATFTQDEYTLTVTEVGNGSVDVEPVGPYTYGEVVTLTATADLGWTFDHWGGALSGSDNPETITMYGDRGVTATFTQDEYSLTVTEVGNGTVDKDPNQATYHYGDVVTLTATADPGWSFVGWSGALSGTDNPATMTITGNTVVTATFSQGEYTLTVNVIGDGGTVIVDPNKATYRYGDVVTLTATVDPGWSFAGWSGALSGTDNPDTVTITGNTVVTASFTQNEYTLTVTEVGSGSVEKEPDQATYPYGDAVTLTANPSAGWSFDSWSGHLSGSDNPETIAMYGHKSVTATFTQDEYTLVVNGVGGGTVTVEPDQASYRYGDVVTLTAEADADWNFAGWSGALSGTDNPATLTITGDTVVTATFSQDEYTLSINVIGDGGEVTVEPDQASYHYGDVVTLTATADPGWNFAGWGGALSGTDNPATLTITGDIIVTATFSQRGSEIHQIFLPIITRQHSQ